MAQSPSILVSVVSTRLSKKNLSPHSFYFELRKVSTIVLCPNFQYEYNNVTNYLHNFITMIWDGVKRLTISTGQN